MNSGKTILHSSQWRVLMTPVVLLAGFVWSQQAYLKASNTGASVDFRRSFAVSGATVVVGAIGESSNATLIRAKQSDNSAFSGAAYISVTPPTPEDQIQAVCDDLQLIVDANPGSPLADKTEDAADKCRKALAELTKSPPDLQAAAGAIEGAVGDLEALASSGLMDPSLAGEFMDRLVDASRQIAQNSIDDAIANGGNAKKIAEAQDLLAQGDDLRAASKFKDAAAKYKDAISKADNA